jgi:hypothetical protein
MFYGMAAGKNKPVPEPPNMMNQGWARRAKGGDQNKEHRSLVDSSIELPITSYQSSQLTSTFCIG